MANSPEDNGHNADGAPRHMFARQFLQANDRRLPLTVISGFLGAGKAILLKHILTECENRRVALDAASARYDALPRRPAPQEAYCRCIAFQLGQLDSGSDNPIVVFDDERLTAFYRAGRFGETDALSDDVSIIHQQVW